jgi:predicted O-methyltransferase YrrM
MNSPVSDASRRPATYNKQLLVNDVLRSAEDDGVGKSIGYPAWNLLYYAALSSLPADRPAVVVETGTYHGLSTVVLAQALKDNGLGGIVHTVDRDPGSVDIARRHVEQAGLSEFVRFHVGESQEMLKDVGASTGHVDFAFLDDGHDRDAVVGEFRALYPLVRRSGVVYFDNTSDGGVKKALDYIHLRYRGNLVELFNCSWWPPGNAIWQPRSYRRFRRPAALVRHARYTSTP